MGRFPCLLQPAIKDYLWGGTRLNDDYNLNIKVSPFAEAWMCSTHMDGVSYVPKRQCGLDELLKKHPNWLGLHSLQLTGGEPILPILIKLIDAKKDLSIQVHPDDEYAGKVEGSLGKTEMWYVLDSKKDASLVFGFNRDMDRTLVENAIQSDEIEKYMNHVPVERGQRFFIEPGTVHAIGAGVLLAEIQENSNITYRLYDYNRVDKSGLKRPLHLKKALDVMRLQKSTAPRQPMRLLKYRRGYASELMSRCRYFQVERILINTEIHRALVDYRTGANSFHALLCIEGCGSIRGEREMMNFFKGDCIFVPADSEPLKIHGKAQLLDISC